MIEPPTSQADARDDDVTGEQAITDGEPRADDDAAIATADGLVLVSTPIGNLGDVTARALAALRAADLVLCEDTRVTARLLAAHGIATSTSPLHEFNEEGRIPGLLEALRAGRRIALVSDAGTPLVSDPGYRLVRAALAAGLPVTAVPGPNAAVLALVLSGLPPQPFLFLGFPPPRSAARRAAFGRLRAAERAGLSATLIWHEAPHRLAETLVDLAAAFGDRPAAVARELTKRFEEVRREGLTALSAHYAAHPARGEITLLIGPAPEEALDAEDLDGQLRAALATNTVKDAAALVAGSIGLPRRLVYARALDLSRAAPPDGDGDGS
jgi:16S rRNA (cytidine1402-2'-O)-methyltransferase